MTDIEHWHDLAVEIVDGIRGFSVEFASDPQRQRDEYEVVKGVLARHDLAGATDALREIVDHTFARWEDSVDRIEWYRDRARRALEAAKIAGPDPKGESRRTRPR